MDSPQVLQRAQPRHVICMTGGLASDEALIYLLRHLTVEVTMLVHGASAAQGPPLRIPWRTSSGLMSRRTSHCRLVESELCSQLDEEPAPSVTESIKEPRRSFPAGKRLDFPYPRLFSDIHDYEAADFLSKTSSEFTALSY